MKTIRLIGLAVALASLSSASWAADFQCEVLKTEGSVTAFDEDGKARAVKEGDLLRPGESIEAAADSYADISFDKDWNNISRIEASSKAKIAAIAPSRIEIDHGGIFAKLKRLPRDSSFEIKTPTAVASVRGTEYRTVFENGKTDVFNASGSKIYVSPLKEDGTADRENSVILREAKRTSVDSTGKPPIEPADMSAEEKDKGRTFREAIQKNIDTAVEQKREAQVQSIDQIEEYIREEKKKARTNLIASDQELSRVTDTRRRAFGGGETSLAPPPREPEPEPLPEDGSSESDA